MGRQSIIDQTTTIDDANLSKIQGLSEIAMQELNSFDTVVESDVAEKYEKIKKEILANNELASAAREIKQALKVM